MKADAEKKQAKIAQYRRHERDTGSAEVQIALVTGRLEHLTEHLKTHKKDHASRRGLLMMVGHRAQLLKYLAATSPDRYQALIERLGLRR
jgi:small subunit ribosomal protein S15